MAERNKKLESYSDGQYFIENPTRDDMRQSDRVANLRDISRYIYQSLTDFQGKWNTSDRTNWIITMPNARYLDIGDTIKNTTTGKIYRIAEIIDYRTKMIRLSGVDYPVSGNILELTEDNMVNFVSDYSSEYKDKPSK